MITVLTGENNFEISRALDAIVESFDGTAEKFDGGGLELSQLPDLLLGGTLFASERLIIIKDLSTNKALWDVLPEWLERVDTDSRIVLVEPKPDKRTKTFKELKKHADVKEFALWGDRDQFAVEAWAIGEAKRQGVDLDKKSAHALVERIGLDQWQLYHAIEKLSVLEAITPDIIEEVIEPNPTENVFNLFEAALRGDSKKVTDMIKVLQRTQDPYMTFGLLSGQAFQLAALASTTKSPTELASSIGAHPYALSKLAPHARNLGKPGAKKVIRIFADTDVAMKSSATDTWLLIEKALIQTVSV